MKKVLLLLFCCVWSFGGAAMEIEGKVYRTGLEAKKGRFSVSPDGRYLIFETNLLAHGLRLMDMGSGNITVLPAEAGRALGFPSWSPDGRQVAVASAPVRDNRYVVDDMQIALLDISSWRSRTIAAGEGVKWFPFFSADGKTVYYFKGKKRESGKTVASRYDLFAIDLASGQETKLTDEAFYQMGSGDGGRHSVLFAAMGGSKRFKGIKDALGQEDAKVMFLYDNANGSVAPINVDQSSGIFGFSDPRRDKAGNLFFIAAKARPGGGHFLWFLVRSTSDGKSPVVLIELPISMSFDIARNTGEIYVMDKQGDEIVFRRLTVLAAH